LTVTDANLLLGRLDPDYFLGGRMALDVARVERVAAERARAWQMRVPELAEGIVRVANANMERAIRVVSVERGHDPRQFALVAFGGAGGMHACEIALRLEIASVLVPKHAGVLSALGMLVADVTRDYAATVLRPSSELGAADLDRAFRPLVARATRELGREGFPARRRQIDRLIDVRYRGQSYEITLPWQRDFVPAFHLRHGTLYGYANQDRATEVVAVRVRASGLTDKPELPFSRPRRAVLARPIGRRTGRFGGRQVSIALYRWNDLAPGARAQGPAVVTGGEATVVVPPGFGFRVDGYGNLVLRSAPRRRA
jgi:N-methylhydantoinase A/oxoprolinase/acetone carboxylase beta subunit